MIQQQLAAAEGRQATAHGVNSRHGSGKCLGCKADRGYAVEARVGDRIVERDGRAEVHGAGDEWMTGTPARLVADEKLAQLRLAAQAALAVFRSTQYLFLCSLQVRSDCS